MSQYPPQPPFGQPSQPLPPQQPWQQPQYPPQSPFGQSPSQPLPPQPNTQWGQQPQYPPQQAFGQSPWQQPPSPSQPLPPQQPQYPPQQPQQQPGAFQQPSTPLPQAKQPKKPKKRHTPWGWIIASLIIGVIIGYAAHIPPASSASTANTPQATQQTQATHAPAQPTATTKPTPTPHAATWTTVQSFSGNGTKKTSIFSVPDDWKVLWTCQGFTDGSNLDGSLNLEIDASDNTPIDLLSENCKANSTSSGESEEHQSGSVYLSIDATGPWTVKIQVLQ